MKIQKKIKEDNFITLDYERIKEEVNINIPTLENTEVKLKPRFLKFGISVLMVLIISVVSIIVISGRNSSNKYIVYGAENKNNFTYTDYSSEGFNNFLEKLNMFSANLSEGIYEQYNENENYIISPISIYMALAMCVEASNQNTREQLLNALDMTYEEVNQYASYLHALLNDEGKEENIFGNDKTLFKEILANSIWLDDTIELNDEGLLNLSKKYKCSSYSAPFTTNTKKANKAIRDYVEQQTNGLINKDFKINGETLFTLINTYYLKDTWNFKGDELTFSPEKILFNNLVETSMLMGYYFDGKPYETEIYTHFFTKTNKGIKIKFIIPNEGYTIDDIYTKEVLSEVNSIKDYKEIDHENKQINYTRCIFPEFKAEFDEEISELLKKHFGIEDMFDDEQADFSNIAHEPIYCKEVKHVTKLEVNRKGIEGASVTVIPGAGAAGPPEYEIVRRDFIVNKNFIVLVTNEKDICLFSGIIYNI